MGDARVVRAGRRGGGRGPPARDGAHELDRAVGAKVGFAPPPARLGGGGRGGGGGTRRVRARRSMGAATALLHAHRDPSIAALVLDSPFTDLRVLAMVPPAPPPPRVGVNATRCPSPRRRRRRWWRWAGCRRA